jgi:hypothetical protein
VGHAVVPCSVGLTDGEIEISRTHKASSEKISIQMITLIAVFRLIPMKANYETKKKMNKTLAGKTAPASRFPERLMNPQIRKQSYEEQTNGNEIEIWH